MSNVCEHGYLTRKCPHCENAELEAKIQATEADNAKHLEAVDHYRTKVQELEDFLRRIYACKDATCDQCAAEIEAHLSTEDGSSREPEGVVEAPLVDGPRRAAVGTDQGDADTYFNEWQFAHQVAEERADRIGRLQAEVARLREALVNIGQARIVNSTELQRIARAAIGEVKP